MQESGEIELLGLEMKTVIGVRPEERTAPRTLSADLVLGLDLAKAARSDDLRDTVDWAALAEGVRAWAAAARFGLVEAFAGALADYLLAYDERIERVSVRVCKGGAVPGARTAAVTIRRGS
ncbi:MAG: dihydroneopterin aldolase [Kiritimatiellae bacterium]|nr:dihydroneopterin aldolase [Kiritimatiellia bacterium]